MPTAFDRVLSSAADVMGLFNHDVNWVLGRRSAGTLRLSKDERGLKYVIDHDASDPQHESVYAKLKRGDIIGSSFSFTVRDEKVRRIDGGFVRELHDVNLIEVSPVWRPAYESTTASARSGAERGSVRWIAENPHSREARDSRLREIERDLRHDRERQLVAVRLRLLEVDN